MIDAQPRQAMKEQLVRALSWFSQEDPECEARKLKRQLHELDAAFQGALERQGQQLDRAALIIQRREKTIDQLKVMLKAAQEDH